jgi:hypothetical protein
VGRRTEPELRPLLARGLTGDRQARVRQWLSRNAEESPLLALLNGGDLQRDQEDFPAFVLWLFQELAAESQGQRPQYFRRISNVTLRQRYWLRTARLPATRRKLRAAAELVLREAERSRVAGPDMQVLRWVLERLAPGRQPRGRPKARDKRMLLDLLLAAGFDKGERGRFSGDRTPRLNRHTAEAFVRRALARS